MLFYKHISILLLKECEVLLELAEVRLSVGPLSSALQLAQDLLKMSQTHCLGELNNVLSIITHAAIAYAATIFLALLVVWWDWFIRAIIVASTRVLLLI